MDPKPQEFWFSNHLIGGMMKTCSSQRKKGEKPRAEGKPHRFEGQKSRNLLWYCDGQPAFYSLRFHGECPMGNILSTLGKAPQPQNLRVGVSKNEGSSKPIVLPINLRIHSLKLSKNWTLEIPWLIHQFPHISARFVCRGTPPSDQPCRATTHASLPPLKDTVNSPTWG